MNFLSNAITFLRSWKTTLSGVLPLIFGALIGLGIIDLDPESATDAVTGVLESGVTTLESIVALIAGSVGAIGIFSKDGDKSTEEVM